LTCYLLQARKGGEDTGAAPAELVNNLRNILPGMNFETIGFAMLQSGVAAERQVSLRMESRVGTKLRLNFTPIAYDRETGSITARSVEVEMSSPHPSNPGSPRPQSMLSTDTIFRGRQYTVLGATGQDPLFVVVHIVPAQLD